MIEDEDPTFRIVIIILNALSIILSAMILLLICSIKQLHERQGHTIQIVLVLECIYSFLLILSQFYYDELDTYETTFYVQTNGVGCIIIGVLSVTTSFAYFSTINIYSLESLNILSVKLTRDYKLRFLAIGTGSSLFGLIAYLTQSIGFNKIGICSLLPGTVFTVFLLLMTIITLIVILWTSSQINRLRKVLGQDLTSRIQDKKYKVNLVYTATFLIIRIIPVLILTIISLADSDTQTYTIAFYILAIPMSLGGVALSLIRAQEPTIQDFLHRKLKTQKSGIVELPKVEVRALSNSLSKLNESQIIKTHYLSYIQGTTTRDNSVAYRKTCIENEELVAKLTSQIESNQIKLKIQEFLLIFKVIRELEPIQYKITQITHYHMKHMRQKIFYFDNCINQINAIEIICTSYAEPLFEQILPIETLLTSFEDMPNQQFIQQLINTRNKPYTNSLTTYDGQVLLTIINNSAKRYLTRFLLQAYQNLKNLQIIRHTFLPPLFGLYSIVYDDLQYTVLIQKNLINTLIYEKLGFKVIGFFIYQIGQVDAEIKGGQQDIYQKIKMNVKVKQEFLDILNQDLVILRDCYLWGYSANILYLEHEDTTQILPNMYRTRNGYVVVSLGGVLDQFWINSDHNEYANPELYASQLAQQIDLLF